MRNVKSQFMLVALLLGFQSGYAATVAIKPAASLSIGSCPVIKVKAQGKHILLGSESGLPASKIYFLKNISQKSIWLDRPAKIHAAIPGWSSYLRPGQWSALWLDKKEIALSCAVIHPGRVEYLYCAKSISVCMPQHLSYHSNRKGSYWMVEGKSWEELLKALSKKGVK